MNVGDELARYVSERLNYSRSMISEHFNSVPYKNYWVGYTQALADVREQYQKLVAEYCAKICEEAKKNDPLLH